MLSSTSTRAVPRVTKTIKRTRTLTVRPQNPLIENTALSLAGYIRHPDPPDRSALGLEFFVQVVPEGLVAFFREAVGLRPDDRDVAGFGGGVGFGDVLLDV